ncbi:MAG: purine-nucleoside phosphorylase [Candidatus Verstraetearchaeota archaeon]|nr:purine-nucleoside phosphorylase [Candidatus Verstraetearchaeota archaeon]
MVPVHHLKCRPGEVAERVVVFGDPCRTKRFSALLDGCRQVNRERCLLTYTGRYNGIEVTLSTTGMGTPSAAIVSEELAALGARCIIRAGTAGSVSAEVQTGDAIVPTEAIPLDGTTKAYRLKFKIPAGSPRAASEVSEKLFAHATSRGVKARMGKVCTSDAFYLEDERRASYWARRGVLGFEMECAVIFTIGMVREYMSGAILVVTGDARSQGSDRVKNTTEVKRVVQECVISALETAITVNPT